MIKENIKQLITGIIVILLPMTAGLFLWRYFPEQMPIHWNLSGEADGWADKNFAVFGPAGIILAAHLICIMSIAMDPKRKNISSKMLTLIYWICPVVSILVYSFMYAVALGADINITVWVMPLIGILFIVMGNWLHKCQPNYTVGIKLPWTLDSRVNWNKTHRMAGYLWVAGGFITVISAFMGKAGKIIFVMVMILLIIVPAVYSYCFYSRHEKNNSGKM